MGQFFRVSLYPFPFKVKCHWVIERTFAFILQLKQAIFLQDA